MHTGKAQALRPRSLITLHIVIRTPGGSQIQTAELTIGSYFVQLDAFSEVSLE